jgi:hypothetical protein
VKNVTQCKMTGSHNGHGRCPGVDFPHDYQLTPIGPNAIVVHPDDLGAFLADVNAQAAEEAANDAATRRALADFTLDRLADATVEATLACGDTISVRTAPAIGAYRRCIHCDKRERVTAVIDHTVEASPRPLWDIAREIRSAWPAPYFGAVPYIDAMACLSKITDSYGLDDADGIVRYFLVNARTWKGDTARRVKAELKSMLRAGAS